jgi:hypothetical protein
VAPAVAPAVAVIVSAEVDDPRTPEIHVGSLLDRDDVGEDGMMDFWEISETDLSREKWNKRDGGRPVRVSDSLGFGKKASCGVCVGSALIKSHKTGAKKLYCAIWLFDTEARPRTSEADAVRGDLGCSYAFGKPRVVRASKLHFVRAVICSVFKKEDTSDFYARILAYDRGELDGVGPSALDLARDDLPKKRPERSVTDVEWSRVRSAPANTRESDAYANYNGDPVSPIEP